MKFFTNFAAILASNFLCQFLTDIFGCAVIVGGSKTRRLPKPFARKAFSKNLACHWSVKFLSTIVGECGKNR